MCKAAAADDLKYREREAIHPCFRLRLVPTTLRQMKPSGKDFIMKIKISRREAKESRYWLRLVDSDGKLEANQRELLNEAEELMKIFGAIVRKSEE
jgi:hypothetical protein